MNFNPIILSIPVYFLLIGIELVIQAITKRKIYRLSDALSNISCGIVSQLSGIGLKVVTIGIYTLIYQYARFFTIPSNWLSWIILFIAVDFFYYWAHRYSHQINLFWGGHVVHHQSEDYNFSVALRQSSFQVIWTFFFYLPLALVGFNPIDFLIIAGLTTVYQFWIHTETIGKLGWLEYVLNTPSHHRVHHGRDPKYIDKNHAGVFIIWDKMFGTFQQEEEKPTYGITIPLNSWNPIWANFSHYKIMFEEIKTIKGLKNKILYLFKKPGWLPDSMGGYRAPKPVNKTGFNKYDTPVDNTLARYLIFQYLLVLAITAIFLFNVGAIDIIIGISSSLFIILSVVIISRISEMKSGIWIMEYARLVIMAVGGYLLSVQFVEFPNYIFPSFLALIVISAFYLSMLLKSTLSNTRLSK